MFCNFATKWLQDIFNNIKDPNEKYEEGVDLMVDPSSNWKQDNHPVYFSEISSLPLAFRQALGMTFPNTVTSLSEARIAVMDTKDA